MHKFLIFQVYHNLGSPPQQTPKTPNNRKDNGSRLDRCPIHGVSTPPRYKQLRKNQHLSAAGIQEQF